MKQVLFYLFLICPFLLHGQPENPDQKIMSLLDEADVAGLSLAVIRGGELAYKASFGVKSLYEMDPVTDETIFAAASLSKPVFSYALLQLVDEGQFDLDRPLFEYMPYPDVEHDDRYKKVTARMVLCHQSGLPNWRQGKLDFIHDPGTAFQYSGEGFVWLMKVIEKITDKDIDRFVRERIFDPLEMENTSYVWKDRFEANYAVPHDDDLIPASKYKPDEGNVAHSLQTTAVDYAKFLVAVLQGNLFRDQTADEIFGIQNHVPEKLNTSDAHHESVFWGLGFGLQRTRNGISAWHWGDNGTFKCFFMLNLDSGSGLIYFTNSSTGLSITPEIVEHMLGDDVPSWTWLNYEPFDSPTRLIYKGLQKHSLEEVLSPYLDQNGRHQDTGVIDERAMNRLGYRLMQARKLEEAKEVFKMNIAAYPESSNVYDSYAEAGLKSGNTAEAIAYYKKSLALNPENKNAERIIAQLDHSATGEGLYRFELRAHQHAHFVSVIGGFNNWNNLHTICRLVNNRWIGYAKLEAGTYEYKFYVDGVSILDPQNPESKNEGGWHRSVLTISEEKD